MIILEKIKEVLEYFGFWGFDDNAKKVKNIGLWLAYKKVNKVVVILNEVWLIIDVIINDLDRVKILKIQQHCFFIPIVLDLVKIAFCSLTYFFYSFLQI